MKHNTILAAVVGRIFVGRRCAGEPIGLDRMGALAPSDA